MPDYKNKINNSEALYARRVLSRFLRSVLRFLLPGKRRCNGGGQTNQKVRGWRGMGWDSWED